MEFVGGGGGLQVHPQRPPALFVAEASASSSSSFVPHLDEESMWQMSYTAGESMVSGPYPERPGEPDCAYYLRTGLCRFGVTCRFNHPPNRKLAVERMKGAYPERAGQLECQYFLKTGTCKFGPTCKFHHPKDKAGITGRVQLNALGYPLRPNEKECAYYLRTGQCKFSNTCKFHHPQPSNSMLSLHGSTAYPSVQSPTNLAQQSFTGELTNWPTKTPFIASPRWQGPSSYAQLILPQGLVQVPSWNSFPGKVGSASTPLNQHQNSGDVQFLGTSLQNETTAGSLNSFSSVRFGSVPVGQYALQRGSVFPERPGEPECQFYMKTGDCKFGAVCKFHHPRERIIPTPNCMLSPLGLPLRPGEPLCIFYSRYGICKFGPTCKFDHPIAAPVGIFAYGFSATSPSPDVPIVRRLLGSSSSPPALTLPLESSSKAVTGNSRRIPLSDLQEINSDDDNTESE